MTEKSPTAAAVGLTSTADPHRDVTVTKAPLARPQNAELLLAGRHYPASESWGVVSTFCAEPVPNLTPASRGRSCPGASQGLEMGYRVGARGDHVPERRGSAEVSARRTLPTTPDNLFEVAAVAERPRVRRRGV